MTKNLINKQYLEIEFDSKEEAFRLRNSLRQVYWDEILPLLDQLFSELAPGEVVYRMDRLVLDLGVVTTENLTYKLISKIKEVLPRQIEEKKDEFFSAVEQELFYKVIEGDVAVDQKKGIQKRMIGQRAMAPGVATDSESASISKPTSGMMISDDQQDALTAILHFFRQGTLPWWVASEYRKSPDELFLVVLGKKPEVLIRALKNQSNPEMLRRMVLQLSEPVMKKLWTALKQEGSAIIHAQKEALRADLEKIMKATGKRTDIGRLTHVVSVISRQQAVLDLVQPSSPERIQQYMIQDVCSLLNITPDRLPEIMARADLPVLDESGLLYKLLRNTQTNIAHADASSSLAFQELKQNVMHQKEIIKEEEEAKSIKQTSSANNEVEPDLRSKRSTPKPETGIFSSQREIERLLKEGGSLVNNAGLVLLAPFFPSLFKKLELTEGRAFRSVVAQERAVLLTQFLIAETTEMAEHKLLLNKLICGWPLHEPLSGSFQPTTTEKVEIQDLLQSAKDHWKALGNTSVNGLRHAFLERKGRLSIQDEQYFLLVERKGMDILLEHIPWGFALIKLPWMKWPLSVEW